MKKIHAKNSQVFMNWYWYWCLALLPIIFFSYGAEICPPLVQLTGHVSALIGYIEMWISHHASAHVILSFFRVNKKNEINPLSANPRKWPNTLKQFVGKLPTNCLSVFGRFVNLAFKGLRVPKYLCNCLFTKTDLEMLQKYWRNFLKKLMFCNKTLSIMYI